MAIYSGKDIVRAGIILRNSTPGAHDSRFISAMETLSYWRLSHEDPLVQAEKLIQPIIRKIDHKCVFAKRPKRAQSIILKLQRFQNMSLKNMNDIRGCRAIFSNKRKWTEQ